MGKNIKQILHNKDFYYAIPWLTFILSPLNVYINLATGKIWRVKFYNSDFLYLPSLYADIFTNYDISGWKLPAAPYFFPDMILFFIINFLTNNFHLTIVLYGVIQSLLFMLSLIILSNLIFGHNKIIASLLLFTGTIFFLLFPAGGDTYALFSPILFTVYHFGVIVSIIFSVSLVAITIEKSPNSKKFLRYYLLLFILSTVVTASDMLYVVQFTIPILGSIFILFMFSVVLTKQTVTLYFILISSVPTGIWLNRLLVRFETLNNYNYTQIKILDGLLNFQIWVTGAISDHFYSFIVWIIFVLVAIWMLLLSLKELHTQKNINTTEARFILFVSFLLLAIVTNILAIILTNNYLLRYFIPSMLMPIFFGWPFLIANSKVVLDILQKNYQAYILSVLFGLILFGGLLSNITKVQSLSNLLDYYPDFVKCLDENSKKANIKNGIADYWTAKHVSMLSKNNLHVVQSDKDMRIFHWINNINWYNEDFEFIIIQGEVDKANVVKYFGTPADSFSCDEATIMIYNRPEDVRFQQYLRKQIWIP